MKIANAIISVVLLAGLAALISPGPRDREPPAYHAPQQQHMRNIAKALVAFEHENNRQVKDFSELESYIDLKGMDIGVSRDDFHFTTPNGVSRSWILYPVLGSTQYLVASPPYDWHGEIRRLAHRFTESVEENVILKEPRNET
jgi:hypothetical protein